MRAEPPAAGAPHDDPGPPARPAPAALEPAAGLPLRRELARKGLHLLSAAAPLAYAAGLPRRTLVVGLALLAVVAVVVELGRARSERARRHFTRYTGALLRAHEHGAVSGATWMLAAYLFAAVAYPRAVAIAAMWAVGVGDASAAVVGRWWGARRARAGAAGGKTYAGTLACFAATLVGAWWVAGLAPASALAAALLAAAAERPRAPLDDNLRIVLAVGLVALAAALGGALLVDR